MAEPLVRMENIHKWFGNVHALRGVNLNINQAEITVIVGDNGAGKSTLIKILTGVFLPTKGKVFLRGKEIKFSSPRDSRDNGIETVYQDETLADDLSIERNLFMGKELRKTRGLIKLLDLDKMRKESKRLLNEFGLEIQSMNQQVKLCSGGERQGIALARAMCFKADLVVLDEPTRALGIAGIKEVLNYVRELKKREISCLLISNDIYNVYPMADRFVVFSRGNITEDVLKKDTSIEELFKLMVR